MSEPVHIARIGYYDLKSYRHARAWVGNTQGLCDYLVRQGLPAAGVFYIGNFVDIPAEIDGDHDTYREQLGIPGDALVVLTVSRLHKVKGIDVLLHARTHLPERINERPVHFIIAGDGPIRRELERLARFLPFNERTHFVGWQMRQTTTRPSSAFAIPQGVGSLAFDEHEVSAAIGAFGLAGGLDRQIHPGMGIPQTHARQGAVQGQIDWGDLNQAPVVRCIPPLGLDSNVIHHDTLNLFPAVLPRAPLAMGFPKRRGAALPFGRPTGLHTPWWRNLN